MPTMPNATAQSRNDHMIRDRTDVDHSRRARDIGTKGTNRVSHTGSRPVRPARSAVGTYSGTERTTPCNTTRDASGCGKRRAGPWGGSLHAAGAGCPPRMTRVPVGAVAGCRRESHKGLTEPLQGLHVGGGVLGHWTQERTKMRIQLRSALVGSAAAIALLAVPGAALASQGNDASIESSPSATVAMSDMPPGMQTMMNSPGHEYFMASPGHEHVMNSPGHQAMMN